MKRKLLIVSIILFAGWMIGFFILEFPVIIHTVLWLSAIFLLRSLFIRQRDEAAGEPAR